MGAGDGDDGRRTAADDGARGRAADDGARGAAADDGTRGAASRDDAAISAEVAAAASRFLLDLRGADDAPEGRALGAAGDRGAQQLIARRLAAARPGEAVLSEEAADDATRLDRDRVWIVDPLDGTREYGEGRADWAVHVALWERGGLAAGAVALPGLGLTLDTATVTPPSPSPRPQVALAVSRSRASDLVLAVAERLGASLVPMGSAGYKVAAVVRGEVDAYLHSGGQYEWDSAAPVAVARAAGLHASRVDGTPLAYNQANPYLPDLLVCRAELADQLLTAVRAASAGSAAR
ncbi:3'(2'),5'-bisphosphate nucleotidase CysQ [Georgenia sp. TF02-10]|uniref:3'(2'),5'-bisphosphate nucleotidase CysQ n=1 Tax=Georgenia sp. TF02-10 TaxID=2917725 RepID=UPI001FA70075|nr:3'(2'),5'-bisphosphate nucleotidase CysQ [Georgenia sp. TF02-10]UNX55591.1 3'(2'),5'-bisphosphate nucleotidase CysQ [Georgenia sp. TF02-10]